MPDLEERLDEARRVLGTIGPPPDLWERVIERSSTHDPLNERTVEPRRRTRGVVLVAVAVLIVVALVAAIVQDQDDRTVKTVPATDDGNSAGTLPNTPAPERVTTPDRVPDHWEPVAASPLAGRTPATSVWTGDELIIWRGRRMPAAACERRDARYCSDAPLTDSAAYRPSTDTWRVLPPPPSSFESTVEPDVAVWTGREMIVWGDQNSGVAYAPTSNRWRRISAPPFTEPQDPFTMTWTGREVVVVTLNGVAAYDPDANTWAKLPSLSKARWGHQAVWTSAGLVVFGGMKTGGPAVDTIELLARGADHWQTLGTTPALIEAAAAWTGRVIVVVGRTDFDQFTAATIDPATGTWTPIAQPPLEQLIAPSLVWTGAEAVLIGNGRRAPAVPDLRLAVAWNPSSGAWRTLPEAGGLTARSGAAAAWTGSELLVWGGFVSNIFAVGEPIADGGRYTPPAP